MKAHAIETKFADRLEQEDETQSTDCEPPIMENDAVKQAVESGDLDAFKKAFHQSAREYIELYDNNNDGKIDMDELIALEGKELGQALTKKKKKLPIMKQ